MKTFIYALVDPETEEVRYIGKSINPDKRYEDHLKDSRKSYKTNWIRSLLEVGKVPPLRILEETDEEHWREREQHWITWCKDGGCHLTNTILAEEDPSEIRRRVAAGKKHSVDMMIRSIQLLGGGGVSSKSPSEQVPSQTKRMLDSEVKPIFIYALTDPDSGEIRYIGKSSCPNQQYDIHIADHSVTYKTHWIRSLKDADKRPKLEILEQTDEEHWKEARQRWINDCRWRGCRLTNVQSNESPRRGYAFARPELQVIVNNLLAPDDPRRREPL